jgi:hypothetical protein
VYHEVQTQTYHTIPLAAEYEKQNRSMGLTGRPSGRRNRGKDHRQDSERDISKKGQKKGFTHK